MRDDQFYLKGKDFALSEIVEERGVLYFNNIYTPQVEIEYVDDRGLINGFWDFPEEWEDEVREKLNVMKGRLF